MYRTSDRELLYDLRSVSLSSRDDDQLRSLRCDTRSQLVQKYERLSRSVDRVVSLLTTDPIVLYRKCTVFYLSLGTIPRKLSYNFDRYKYRIIYRVIYYMRL